MEDELEDIVSSGLENEGDDLAAMVGKAGACLGIATAMAAATAASANTNTASAGLHTASVGCMAALSVFVANPSDASAAEAKGAIDDYMSMLEAFCGSDIAAAYRAAVESGDQEAMDAIIGRIQDNVGDYERAGEAQPPRDPLIIDFGAE